MQSQSRFRAQQDGGSQWHRAAVDGGCNCCPGLLIKWSEGKSPAGLQPNSSPYESPSRRCHSFFYSSTVELISPMRLNQQEMHLAHCGEGNCSLPSSPGWAVAAKINRVVDEGILSFCQYPEFSIRKKWNFSCWSSPTSKMWRVSVCNQAETQGTGSCSGCLWESFLLSC